MEYACEIVGLVKRFGSTTAVDQLSLKVPTGMLYGFLGVNGAGKTTTLRMISGLIRPDAGEIRVCGIDAVAEPQRAKQPLAYIPDDPVLYGRSSTRWSTSNSSPRYGTSIPPSPASAPRNSSNGSASGTAAMNGSNPTRAA